ncbi:hypothetical protein ACJIZ3_009905 [Penstemon smallii]|uniref:DUF4228 domain protein n=1 Tax=Penstemon smallii TaxID=265156 RepID=A0ABD3TDU7_9LAMI
MGNCQAIDNATIVIQHPKGKVDKLYCPVSANEIMKLNPGHYVALLLTTTLYSPSSSSSSAAAVNKNNSTVNHNKIPLRVTRIKLLRPTDTLVLGHVYRLVTTKEVMKGLWAKKQKQKNPGYAADKYGNMTDNEISDCEEIVRKTEAEKHKQVKKERQRSRNSTPVNSAASKSRAWQPSLISISEAGS